MTEQEQPNATPDTPTENKPVSIVDEARGIRDEIKKERELLDEANKKKETLQTEDLLSSSSGGHIETKLVSPEDKKVNDAKEFFKDTALEGAIDQANEKK